MRVGLTLFRVHTEAAGAVAAAERRRAQYRDMYGEDEYGMLGAEQSSEESGRQENPQKKQKV